VKTILVVDDEVASAEVLSLILEEEGYRVFTAANGRQGLDRIDDVQPDLVILDYMMPLMNGTEMGRALRASERWRHLRIVMNSSMPEATVREHFDGYDFFLRKPYNIEEALRLIRELLDTRRYQGNEPSAPSPDR
jgi:CheY-like chemotaxis protein